MIAELRRAPELDFEDSLASSGVYSIHPYPAMFHYELVRFLLEEYSRPGDLVFDPFVGSGVVAVEGLISGRPVVGYDINPLAILIARVRTTPLSYERLQKSVKAVLALAEELQDYEVVSFDNIDYWFSQSAIESLSRIKKAIDVLTEQNESLRNFMLVAFSETVRKCSYASHSEFKLIRRKANPPDPRREFYDIALRNAKALEQFYKEHPPTDVKITLEVRNILKTEGFPGSVDLILTSPPYGDSKTTVAYGQFSKLPLRWLGFGNNVDRDSLGGRVSKDSLEAAVALPSEVLKSALSRISQLSERRAKEVGAFFVDYYKCIRRLSKLIKPGKYAIFVVGNRRVRGVEIRMDAITAEFFESMGYSHEITLVRKISNKRMPSKNSPSNVKGAKEPTMKHEYIVVLKNQEGEKGNDSQGRAP